jgi:glutamine amidotransferase
MMVTVFDYGAGNLHSLLKALDGQEVELRVEPDARRLVATDLLVLPGVGAFGAATERLAPGREDLRAAILDGLPTLGICLGMQLLLDASDEGAGSGLGVVAGRVTRLKATRIPQIGWNAVEPTGTDELLAAAAPPMAYYANSYVCRPIDESVVTAWTRHEHDRFPAAIRMGRTVGVQFHPEKSSEPGLRFLRSFLDTARTWRRST